MEQTYQTREQRGDSGRIYGQQILIDELQLNRSRIPDLDITYWAIGNCSSCPECVCADFLGKEFAEAAGIVLMTPVLLAAKVAWACK